MQSLSSSTVTTGLTEMSSEYTIRMNYTQFKQNLTSYATSDFLLAHVSLYSHLFVRSFVHHLFVLSLIHSFSLSFIHSLVYSFIISFTHHSSTRTIPLTFRHTFIRLHGVTSRKTVTAEMTSQLHY